MNDGYCTLSGSAVRLFQEVEYAPKGNTRRVGKNTNESGRCGTARGPTSRCCSDFWNLSRYSLQMGRQLSGESRFLGGQAHSRKNPSSHTVPTGDSERFDVPRPNFSWLENRYLDLFPRCRDYSTPLWNLLSSGPCLSHRYGKAWMVFPTPRENGARAGSRKGCSLVVREATRDQKKAQAESATLIFADEACFQMMPTRRRTLAPRGITPILPGWDRRDKISTIGAITISPKAQREGFLFQMLPANTNFNAHLVIGFLRHLCRKIPGPIKLVWDGANIHRAKIVKSFLSKHPRVETFDFPPYAPDTNPVEGCWGHAKYHQMPNLLVRDVDDLRDHATESLNNIKFNRLLLKAFICHALKSEVK